jgi:integrative and conjugative element protein (TIGR02256 family)
MQRMALEAQRSGDGQETGGILLGWDHVVGIARDPIPLITATGDPGPTAVRTKTFFRRDIVHAQQIALDAFRKEEAVWLGEWHTHFAGPRPSAVDLASYRRHLGDPALAFESFIALIVTPTWAIEHGDLAQCWSAIHCTPWVIERSGVTRGILLSCDDGFTKST